MGSTTTVEVSIQVLTNLQVPQETTTECSVESPATNTQSNDDAEVPVLEPRDDTTRLSKFTAWRVLEFVLLPTIIAAVWVLLALPTVFYLLSPLIISNEATNTTAVTNCPVVVYTGEICRDELLAQQACLSGRARGKEIHIPQVINQEETEGKAHQLLTERLLFLNSSAECESLARSLLCLYIFGLCDSNNGRVYQPSITECKTVILNDTCAREWQTVLPLLEQEMVPSCEMLPGVPQMLCPVEIDSKSGKTQAKNGSLGNSSSRCSDGFHLNQELDICKPQCNRWQPASSAYQAVIDTFTITAVCTAIICGITFLIFALLQRKEMLTFPKVIFLYVDISLVLGASVILIGYINRDLFCSSMDLVETIQNPTPFCQLSGVVYMYCLTQIVIWGFFYICVLFWATVHPFHFRNFKATGHLTYVHVISTILGVLLPCVPAFITLGTGYELTSIPPIVCGPANGDVGAYALLLPVSILAACSVSMLVVIFWIIMKQHMQNKGKGYITAEKKILVILLYYIVLVLIGLFPFTHLLVTRERTQRTLLDYFTCESVRNNHSNLECDKGKIVTTHLPGLFTATNIAQGLLPAFLLVAFATKTLKTKFVQCYTALQHYTS